MVCLDHCLWIMWGVSALSSGPRLALQQMAQDYGLSHLERTGLHFLFVDCQDNTGLVPGHRVVYNWTVKKAHGKKKKNHLFNVIKETKLFHSFSHPYECFILFLSSQKKESRSRCGFAPGLGHSSGLAEKRLLISFDRGYTLLIKELI